MLRKYPQYPKSDHYDTRKKRFFNTPPTQPMRGGVIGVIPTILGMIFRKRQFMPSQNLPVQTPNWNKFFHNNETQFIWLGHSSFMLRMNGKTLLIDPVFAPTVSPLPIMMYRFQAPPITWHELINSDINIDYIIYSHNHYDHLDKEMLKYFKAKHTKFLVPLGVEVILKSWGISTEHIQALDWWQHIEIDLLKITATPARHNTARGFADTDKSLWCGWVFENGQEKIYYTGDTSYGDGRYFKQIEKYWQGFDLAIIENGQYNQLWPDNHMFPEQTIQAAIDVKAKKIMPVHWGAYALSTHRWDESIKTSTALAKSNNIPTMTPMIGEVVNLMSTTEYWWEKYQ